MPKHRTSILVLLAVAALLAGCGGGGGIVLQLGDGHNRHVEA